ncbi:ZDS1 [Candida theae]|uniref:ZDS1 n=1 Tax=Candida theae TaxID=1198502 RepID=A0AAD5FYU6_9ASCO|nr:ZDS1 [Candida theae]KAI5958598.1 ZDS1 [Candida theae]
MYSPDSSFQNDPNYESAVQDIEQEKKMVAALKRLSIGNLMQYDPDLPPGSMDDVDPFATSSHLQPGGTELYDEELIPQHTRNAHPRSSSLSSTSGSPTKSPSKSPTSSTSSKRDDLGKSPVKSHSSSPGRNHNLHAPSSFTGKSPSPVKRRSLYMDNDSILTTDEEFFDASEDQVYDASNTVWLPAELHPQVNPESFKTLIKHQVEDIKDRNLKRRSTISRRSTLSRQPSIADHEEEPTTTIRVQKNALQEPVQANQDQQNGSLSRTPSLNSSKSASPPKDPTKRESWYNKQKRFSNPSLKELTTELQQLSKMAGMDKSDAVTIARTLSSNSLGYTDVERLAIDELNRSPPHGDTSGTSNTLHLQQRLQQQFNQSLSGEDLDEEEEPAFYSNTLPLQDLHRDFALKRSRRTDYRKKDSEFSASPESSPLSRKEQNHHGKPAGQRAYKTRDSQLLFSYKKLDADTHSEKTQQRGQVSSEYPLHTSNTSFTNSRGTPPGTPIFENRLPSPRHTQRDPHYSNRYPHARNQDQHTPQIQRRDITPQGNVHPDERQYPSRQQYQQHRQSRDAKHLPDLPHQQRQQHSPYLLQGQRNRSPFQHGSPVGEHFSSRQDSHHLSHNKVKNPFPTQPQVKSTGPHHQLKSEKKLMSASNTNINDFMVETPTKQSRHHHHSLTNKHHSRQSSQRPQPDVPMLFPSSKDPQNVRLQNQVHPQQQVSTELKSRSSLRPSGSVPPRSKQLHQNLDLLRSEINEFKESLNKDKRLPERQSNARLSSSQQQQQQQQASTPSHYQVRQLSKQQQQQQNYPYQNPPEQVPESEISFDVSYQDLSTDDPLGIEQEALRELGMKKDHHGTYGVVSAGYDKTGTIDAHTQTQNTLEREPPIKQSTPEHDPPLKQSTPEQEDGNANDDLFANIPDVDVDDDFSDLDDEPILVPSAVDFTDGQELHGPPSGDTFKDVLQLSRSQSPSTPPVEGKLDEPFLKNYTQVQSDTSSRVKTSSKPTKVNTKLFNKGNVQIIDSNNYEEKMGMKMGTNGDDDKNLKKKKSFGILSGGNNLTPPTSSELAADGDKSLRKKKSWNWLRERSSSLSSIDSAQQQAQVATENTTVNPKVPLSKRSFSNPEKSSSKRERESNVRVGEKLPQGDATSAHNPDKENVLSKLFKKKSKANLSNASLPSVHSQESKDSGVTVNSQDPNYDSNDPRGLKKKTSGLFKKRSKTKLVGQEGGAKVSPPAPSLQSKQTQMVQSSLRRNSTEMISPQSSNNAESIVSSVESEAPLLQNLNLESVRVDKAGGDDDAMRDAEAASFGTNANDEAAASAQEERKGFDEDRKLANIDINSLDSSDDIAENTTENGLKSKKSTVKKHKRYRHRKKEKPSGVTEEVASNSSEGKVSVSNVEDPVLGEKKAVSTIAVAPLADAKSGEVNEDGNPSDAALTKEQQQLAKIDIQEKLKKSIKRTSKANQPIEFTDSAFGFPLPPPSQSTIIMLDYRFPVHVERAIYRLSHLKLANPKRSLREQVLLSNFMYAYLNLVDHTLHMEQQMTGANEEEEGEQEDAQDDNASDEEDETMVDSEGEDADVDVVEREEEEHVIDHFGTDSGADVDFGEDVVEDDDEFLTGFSSRRRRVSMGSGGEGVDGESLPAEERIRLTA